jgi:hypothetical protein
MGLFEGLIRKDVSPQTPQPRDDKGYEIIDRIEKLDLNPDVGDQEYLDNFMRAHQALSEAVDHFVPADESAWEDTHQHLVDLHDSYSKTLKDFLDNARSEY